MDAAKFVRQFNRSYTQRIGAFEASFLGMGTPLAPNNDAKNFVAPLGIFLVAISEGEPVACGGMQTIDEGVCEIKRMWVHEDRRRAAGLRSRLLCEFEEAARDTGHTERLDTNAALTEAIEMYRRTDYLRVEWYNDNPYATHFFEKRLDVGQCRRMEVG